MAPANGAPAASVPGRTGVHWRTTLITTTVMMPALAPMMPPSSPTAVDSTRN